MTGGGRAHATGRALRRARGLRPPLVDGLRGYRTGAARADLAAGLAIAAVGLPSAVAYPAIAGLPPETGLYASIAGAVGYAVFGPSRRLIVGPDAATMTVLAGVLATAVAAMPADTAEHRAGAAAAIALLVGGYCLVARAIGFGAIANFLSRPILVGFFAGISLSILVGQIGRVTGLTIEADGLVAPILEALREAREVHWPSLALAAVSLVALHAARVAALPIPGPVIVVVAATALSALFDFAGLGVRVVGAVPTTLPGLALPPLGALPWPEILLGSGAVFLVSFGSGVVAARSFGARVGERVDASGELGGFGAANLAAGLFGGFPVTASDSRTAINLSVGGRSQVAALVSALALVATVLFLGPALSVTPTPALGAILIAAAISLIDLGALREIWRISRTEFLFAMVALGGAVSFGVLQGVVVAAVLTLVSILLRTMRPIVARLGRAPGRAGFYKLHRAPEARPIPGLELALVEGDVLFYNAEAIETQLRALAEGATPPRWLVLDASAMAQIDVTGAIMLRDLAAALAARGVVFGVAEMHAAARAVVERAGVVAVTGPEMVFQTLDEAAAAFETAALPSVAKAP